MAAAKSAANPISVSPMAFLDVLKQATSFKITSIFSSRSTARVDNFLFSLHSSVTIFILSVSIVFVGMKQYFGDPIDCIDSESSKLSRIQMQHYCWMEGAFTTINRNNLAGLSDVTGIDNAYPGVKTYQPHKGDLKMPHKYYQWVYYILCIQCVLFYAPKYFWRFREGGRLRELIDKIKDKHVLQYNGLDRYQVVQDTLDVFLIADEFFHYIVLSEVFYLVHIIAEIFFINAFLGGKFLTLGFQWLHYSHNSDDVSFDPLIRIFPRLTKCSFHKFGSSGSIETYDTLCFMPMNIVNEKVFVILWFWFLFLLLATVYHLCCYRASVIFVPWIRRRRLMALAPSANKEFLKKIAKKPGRWFVMNTIAANLKPYYFRDLLEQLQKDHFGKDLRLDSKVFMDTFMVEGAVPLSTLPQPASKPPAPGFITQEKSQETSQEKSQENHTQFTNNQEENTHDDWESTQTTGINANSDGQWKLEW